MAQGVHGAIADLAGDELVDLGWEPVTGAVVRPELSRDGEGAVDAQLETEGDPKNRPPVLSLGEQLVPSRYVEVGLDRDLQALGVGETRAADLEGEGEVVRRGVLGDDGAGLGVVTGECRTGEPAQVSGDEGSGVVEVTSLDSPGGDEVGNEDDVVGVTVVNRRERCL